MKTILKVLGLAIAAAALVLAAFVAYVAARPVPSYLTKPVALKVEVSPDRVARGKRHVQLLCAGCHFDSGTGGLTGKRMPDLPSQFGRAYSRNITADPVKGIGAWSDGEIAFLLRTGIGRDGRYTPPWMVKLPNAADQDIDDIIAFLRSDDALVRAQAVDDRDSEPSLLTKLLCRVAFKPFAYPERPIVAPPVSEPEAFGRYLVNSRLMCYSCHSADFKTNDELYPERSPGYLGGGNPMPDLSGKIVYTSNLTPDAETGLGRWSFEQFRRALVDGIGTDNQPLRYPMVPYRILEEQEVAAIFAYLKSVPALPNAVPSPRPEDAPAGGRGKQAFYKYRCNGCHGDTGLGQYDLRQGPAHYPTDEELIAYIKHPERAKPGIAMPTWDGVIEEEEYAPLAGYVRTLAPAPAAR